LCVFDSVYAQRGRVFSRHLFFFGKPSPPAWASRGLVKTLPTSTWTFSRPESPGVCHTNTRVQLKLLDPSTEGEGRVFRNEPVGNGMTVISSRPNDPAWKLAPPRPTSSTPELILAGEHTAGPAARGIESLVVGTPEANHVFASCSIPMATWPTARGQPLGNRPLGLASPPGCPSRVVHRFPGRTSGPTVPCDPQVAHDSLAGGAKRCWKSSSEGAGRRPPPAPRAPSGWEWEERPTFFCWCSLCAALSEVQPWGRPFFAMQPESSGRHFRNC